MAKIQIIFNNRCMGFKLDYLTVGLLVACIVIEFTFCAKRHLVKLGLLHLAMIFLRAFGHLNN